MSDVVLRPTEQVILTRLIDAIYPSVDDIVGAVKAGVVERLIAELPNPPWNGQARYAQGPFVHPVHAGHGWQSEALARALAVGEVELTHGITSVDLFRILHRYVFETLHGEARYGWFAAPVPAASTAS
jgi:hypothetical protein